MRFDAVGWRLATTPGKISTQIQVIGISSRPTLRRVAYNINE